MYRVLLVLMLVVLQSCIATVVDRGRSDFDVAMDEEASCRFVNTDKLPNSVEMNVSYFYASTQTAASSLGMVLAYYQNNRLSANLTETVEKASKSFSSDDDKASVYDIMVEAENNGHSAGLAMCSIDNLLDLLSQKIPVIIRVLRKDLLHAQYLVVTGYNKALKVLYVNDPLDVRRDSVSFAELHRIWSVNSLNSENNTENLMIVIR